MANGRDDPINDTQRAYLERALAISRDQLQAVETLLSSTFERRLAEDPAVLAATIQAVATNYLAERTGK